MPSGCVLTARRDIMVTQGTYLTKWELHEGFVYENLLLPPAGIFLPRVTTRAVDREWPPVADSTLPSPLLDVQD